MYNFFNFKKFNDKYLITNDMGRYMFIDKDIFKSLVFGYEIKDELESQLHKNYFIFDDEYSFSESCKYALRDSKNYLFESTVLHIFVLTNSCNMKCIYCQAKDEEHINKSYMNKEIAEKSVNIALSSPSKCLTFEFQGGEPLCNFDILKHIVLYTEENKRDKIVSYNLVSNLLLVNDEILDFLKNYNINISTSLDGDKRIHDYNRLLQNGDGSFDYLVGNIEKFKNKNIELSAIQTTTKKSLSYSKQIIDSYVDLGFSSIFLRPLTRLGTAARIWDEIGYTAEEFTEFYSKSLDYIIELNNQGVHIKEIHALIFLKKILHGVAENYMELRSPCGASIGQLAYFYDGNIFTCDEGRMLYEMGNDAFKLCNVFDDTYDTIIKSPTCKTTCIASLLESQLNCSDCVYQPFCGTCPVLNLAQDNDLFFKNINSFRCKVYKGILDKLFTVLKDGKQLNILEKWLD